MCIWCKNEVNGGPMHVNMHVVSLSRQQAQQFKGNKPHDGLALTCPWTQWVAKGKRQNSSIMILKTTWF